MPGLAELCPCHHTTDDTWMQGLWAEMLFSMRCLQRDVFRPCCTSLHFASTEQPLWMLEQGWDPELAQPGIRDGLSVPQMCMCSGAHGDPKQSSNPKGRIVHPGFSH